MVVKFLGDGEWIRVLQGPGLECSWVMGTASWCVVIQVLRAGDIPSTGLRPFPLPSELPVW